MKKLIFGLIFCVGICFVYYFLNEFNKCSETFNKNLDSVNTTYTIYVQDSIKDSIVKKQKQDSINNIKIKELSQYFTEKKDEFSDIKWIEPKTRPKYTNQNGYCMYFAIENGVAVNPRFLIQYEDDDWLFIKYMIFNIDGENITFIPQNMETDCGNGGRIWEWCDESAKNYEELIKKIAYAKSVKIKMNGTQYYDIKIMSAKQIQYFKYSYEYYKALGGTFN